MPQGPGTYGNQGNNEEEQQTPGWVPGAVGGLLSMLTGAIGAQSQHRRQRELMNLQHMNQMALNRQGHQLQFDMWKKTSYPAQLAMMKKAGLSPGLMYGGGPGQGGTTGSQTGGSASGGQASPFQAMDLSNMMKIKAETDLINKQRDDLQSQIDERDGVKRTAQRQQIKESIERSKNLSADTKLKAQQELNLISEKALIDAKTAIENMKFEKGVTGSFLVDTFTQMGLDPMNNPWHRVLINTMIFSWFGAGMLEKIANATTRGMFAKIFGDKTANKYFDQKADWPKNAIDGRGREIKIQGLNN
tara:strand:- start:865 stop:1773 length:909 start_codon:yes stop_codon:yes gene_type:complete